MRIVRSAARAMAALAAPLPFAAFAAFGCGSSANGAPDTAITGGSPCVTAPSCPDGGAPSYKTDIVPILEQDCVPCHSPTAYAGHDESSYASIKPQFGTMLSFTNNCKMPPPEGPQMTVAQRVALTAWLRCGAPDN